MGKFSWIGAAALVLATSAVAEASDRSVQAVMIAPMACQPIRNAGAELDGSNNLAVSGSI